MNRIQQGKDAIGIVGGMGSIATAGFFSALVRAFPADKEWDRPRIVVDNACQMPSRVRALLYGEKSGELVGQLASHMAGLVQLGCTDLLLCCNTSHVFLPQVLPLVDEMTGGKAFHLRHIIRLLGESLQAQSVRQVSLIATEGTLDAGIYPAILTEYGVAVQSVGPQTYPQLRFLIEAAKQNRVRPEVLDRFIALANAQPCPDVVLGCTEFPILRDALGALTRKLTVTLHDPLQAAIAALVAHYTEEIG